MSTQQRLESLLARYVERQVAGEEPPDPLDLCRDEPELLQPLQELIRDYESVAHRLAGTPRDAASLAVRLDGLRRVEPAAMTEDSPQERVTIYPGRLLAGRFRIREELGQGGQGEVWRAEDLKLRVDVALKALRADRVGVKALERLRQEVRVAREVVSPNVCRIFDLVDLEGEELLSMEYVDGSTLYDVLRERGPLALDEALEIASQLLAGLEAIHAAGLVHRDVKPENVMITRTGRVVVMDLGLAKVSMGSGEGSISGTPAYMAPEQAAGGAVDARADVFSAGVLLAEMVHPGGIASRESRRSVWEGVRQEPAALAETLWRPVLARALAHDPDQRFASVRELARALERVTLKASANEVRPYPGLAVFGEADARYFFGREAETEALWKRLDGPSRLLAVAGPSGAGKSSFLRAGLLAAKPEGWATIAVTPGGAPFVALGQAVGEALAGDAAAAGKLVRFPEPGIAVELVRTWRERHRDALLVVDQFEELFTQNPEETQRRFAELLGRLPLEADVHVVFGLRDDFLLTCQFHQPLAPIFSEITPLQAPAGAALRRALTQPALQCGFRFEDDALVDEMLAEVTGERGALPLLAFAVARLWERRDRKAGVLTREAYRAIGGVAGALASHAEATLDRIGKERLPLVRDLFRNLVTAQGTRASRRLEELVSIADDRTVAREIVATLVEARLLTGYESPGRSEDEEPEQRVEIIHESLLSAWPRLVRWRTQDADAAQVREQVRQAARVWDDKGRPEELLWTGASYREFQVWRDRYPGRLTDVEQAFGKAMTTLAGRRRRRRRWAAALAAAVLAAVALTLGIFWRESEAARRRESEARAAAEAETRRAEASKLLALARLELETYPTGALAYTLASLQLADEPAARRFAVETLYRGPTAFALPGEGGAFCLAFSPDRNWLAVGTTSGKLELWSRHGGPPRALEGHRGSVNSVAFGPRSDRLVSSSWDGTVRTWTIPEGTLLNTRTQPGRAKAWLTNRGERIVAVALSLVGSSQQLVVESWPLEGGPTTVHGRVLGAITAEVDVSGTWLATGEGTFLKLYPISDLKSPGRIVGRHDARVNSVAFDSTSTRVASWDEAGELRLWAQSPQGPLLERTMAMPNQARRLLFDAQGSRLAALGENGQVRIWRLGAPAGVEPLLLSAGLVIQGTSAAFSPDGEWFAASGQEGVTLWPLGNQYPDVLGKRGSPRISGLAMAPDGTWVAGAIWRGPIRKYSLGAGALARDLQLPEEGYRLAVDPQGRYLLTGGNTGATYLLPVDGREERALKGFSSQVWAVAFNLDGRLAAAGGGQTDPRGGVIRVWDLEAGVSRVLDPGDGRWVSDLDFLPDGRFISASSSGVRRWNLEDGTSELLRAGDRTYWNLAVSRDGRRMLSAGTDFETRSGDEVRLDDLKKGTFRFLPACGNSTSALAFDPTGEIVLCGDLHGAVRAGRVDGGEPQLLLGHERLVWDITTTPDGRWIVSAGDEGTIRLWPMPDFSRPPLHTLPHDELIARLESLTNLRAVADPGSATGYKLEAGPFLGWDDVPTW